MLRYPAIILVGLFFALGPAPFERLHVNEANKSLARMKALMDRDSHSGSKRSPAHPPTHDPSTCVICAALHSPLTAHHLPTVNVGPIALLGYLRVDASSRYSPISITAEQCRGPPSA
ncbi:MAG TPA: hypothetical protein VGG44_04560 [Tepidisphaeraceae bacterium]